MFIYLISSNGNAGLFSPSNYNECVIDVSKNAKTDAAVGIGISACEREFPSKPLNPIQSIKTCNVYWDGFEFKSGEADNNEFITLIMQLEEGVKIKTALPKNLILQMFNSIEEFKKELNANKNKPLEESFKGNTKFYLFFEKNFYSQVIYLCKQQRQ